MTLAAGMRLGAYEITGSLGAGGMGEVYRATDTRLEREVAIKVLPESVAADTHRIARFEQEAKTLAALNHPNIAHIHGLEQADGKTALVMELVDGPTLADRIAKGPLPPEEALGIAMQIADALEAAHGRGIVHRDLKPANIKLHSDGTVKVLDFGIAKALDTRTGLSGPQAPSLTTPAMTQAGVLLGTAAYMSPEQARGKAVDQRADIWAFGCVLYEMLTGQPAFGGEDVPTTLARVLANATELDSIPAMVSPDVRKAIELCLEKDPKKRLADIRDVRLAINGAFDTGSRATVGGGAARRPLWRRVLPVPAALVVGLGVAGLAVWAITRPGSPDLARFDMTPDGGVTVLTNARSAALAPDGKSIAYLVGGDAVAGGNLVLRRLDQLSSTVLVTLDQAGGVIQGPFFSPDGAQIAFMAGTAEQDLKRVSAQGGPVSTITKLPGLLRGASWGADGTIVFATNAPSTGLWRVRATGGEPESLTTPDPKSGALNHAWPEFLPDERAVLFTIVGASEEDSKIAVVSLATGEQRVLLQGGSSPRYSSPGHLLFARGGTLFAVRFDPARLNVLGDPAPVQEGVLTKGALGAAEASLAANGSLLYLSGAASRAERHLVWVDATGRETPLSIPPRDYDQVVLSPDGTHAALGIAGDRAVWISDLTRGTLERLPADLGAQEPSILFFSADGQRIASSAVQDGRQAVVWQAIDGTGGAEPLVTFDASVGAIRTAALSPDGTSFVPSVLRSTLDLGIASVDDPKSYRDFLATPAQEFGAAIAPDGHWIAYSSNDTGTYQVYAQRFPEGGGRLAVSIGAGVWPRWSADGSALSYMRLDGAALAGVTRVPVNGLETAAGAPTFGRPVDLFPWKYFAVANGIRQFDMTADGSRFLMITDPLGAQASRLVLVQNWSEELKRLVPK